MQWQMQHGRPGREGGEGGLLGRECVLNSVNNILNANTQHEESVVNSLLQHMKLPLLEFKIHADCSAEFVEAQLDWNVFTTQLECIYHFQGKERHNVLMRNNLVKCRKVGSRGMV